MRFVVNLFAMLTVALVVGFGLSYLALTSWSPVGTMKVGPWVAWPEVGAPEPDPYTNAYLTRQAVLQLGRSEGIRFVAGTDSDGRTLDRNCRYRIDGSTPVAAFWTLMAVDEKGVDIARPDGMAEVVGTSLPRPADGSIEVRVSKRLAPGYWYEITGEGRFSLVLTLYDASIFSGLGSQVEKLPAILNEGCA